MKISFLISLFVAFNFIASAQIPNDHIYDDSIQTCFDEYYHAFVTRGVIPIVDGENNVVISSRKDSVTTCGEGRINVIGGKLLLPLLVKKADGTYEEAKKRLHPREGTGERSPAGDMYAIIKGMSQTFVTDDYYVVNLFFVDCLKPAVQGNAPAPSVDAIPGQKPITITEAEKEVIKKAYESLEFKTGSAVILSSSYQALDDMAKMLVDKPTYRLNIRGYTDNVGSASSNMKLSKNRAKSTKNYLVKKGVSADRLIDEGFGLENPIADNTTEEGRAKNRRVEFTVIE